MEAPSRYLPPGLVKSSPSRSRRTLVLWIVLIVLFLVAWNLTKDPSSTLAPMPSQHTDERLDLPWIGFVVAGMTLFVGLAVDRKSRRAQRADQTITRAVEERRFDEAVQLAQDQIKSQPTFVAGYLPLALVAERRGDYADAVIVQEQLREKLAPKGKERWQNGIYVAVSDARRAFALVAIGRLDAADAVLRAPRSLDTHPMAIGLFVRADALLLERRGDRAALARLLREERFAIESSLSLLDRQLLEVLRRWATGDRGPALDLDPFSREWITRLVPDHVALAEAA